MNKRITIITIMLIVLILVAAGCQSSATAPAIKVGEETVPSLYTALGEERAVTGAGTETGIGYTSSKVTYNGVSSDDIMAYYNYLDSNGYTCTDESSTYIQMCREAEKDGYIVMVDMNLTSSDTAEIIYTYTAGELTIYD